jgi:general secretion pathway protein I
MLVALAIFSLAALALLRLGGATATNSARLNEQAIAMIVARNLAVETLTDPQPPAFGTSAGEAVNGGRRWRWTRSVGRSPEARIQQIEIGVVPAAGGPGRARLTIFRRGPA